MRVAFLVGLLQVEEGHLGCSGVPSAAGKVPFVAYSREEHKSGVFAAVRNEKISKSKLYKGS